MNGDHAVCCLCGYGIPAGTGDEITRGPICNRCCEVMDDELAAEEAEREAEYDGPDRTEIE